MTKQHKYTLSVYAACNTCNKHGLDVILDVSFGNLDDAMCGLHDLDQFIAERKESHLLDGDISVGQELCLMWKIVKQRSITSCSGNITILHSGECVWRTNRIDLDYASDV